MNVRLGELRSADHKITYEPSLMTKLIGTQNRIIHEELQTKLGLNLQSLAPRLNMERELKKREDDANNAVQQRVNTYKKIDAHKVAAAASAAAAAVTAAASAATASSPVAVAVKPATVGMGGGAGAGPGPGGVGVGGFVDAAPSAVPAVTTAASGRVVAPVVTPNGVTGVYRQPKQEVFQTGTYRQPKQEGYQAPASAAVAAAAAATTAAAAATTMAPTSVITPAAAAASTPAAAATTAATVGAEAVNRVQQVIAS